MEEDEDTILPEGYLEDRPDTEEERQSLVSKYRPVKGTKNKKSWFQRLPLETRREFGELLHIVPNGYGYTQFQRIDALFQYIAFGSCYKVAKELKLPESTVLAWAKSDWWKQSVALIKEAKQEELDTKYTQVLDRSMEEIMERLENGDEHVVAGGEIVNLKVKTRDLVNIQTVIYKNRALMRGEPTSNSGKASTEDKLQQLMDQFKQIAGRTIDITPTTEEEETDDGGSEEAPGQ